MTQGEQWNYSEDSGQGPSEWPNLYPTTGKFQSPINILVDYCDLHKSNCNKCSNDHHNHHQHHNKLHQQHSVLTQQLEHKLKLEHFQTRRDHLDSVGNDNDSDELQCDWDSQHNRSPSGSSTGSKTAIDSEQRNLLTKDCLTLWKSKKLASPIQMRKPLQESAKSKTKTKTTSQNTRYCVTNKKIFLGYPRYLHSLKLCNTGHGWQADMPAELANHTLMCGPAFGDREYRLAQFHCHWGADCSYGSEHQVNGRSYSAELHFVHWNCSQFNSAKEAAKHKHGLAVLAVFVQALEGEQNRNKHLDKLMEGIRAVCEQPQSSIELNDTKLDLKKLFPINRWDYATYEGSLTTPPLSEVVDWLVFLQPIECSYNQIDQFRRLKCPSGPLTTNCRPVQAHNQRQVTIWTHSHSH